MKRLRIQLLLTGNELMIGDIIDSNSAMIAQQLKDLGIEVQRKVTVADDLSYLVDEITHMSQQADILIINGGLGPTVDDLTAQALAQASNTQLVENIHALVHLTTWCDKRGVALSHPNLKQAMLPENCHVIANPVGSAVGFTTRFQHCDIYCTPGVPHELKRMMTQEIMPHIAQKLTSDHYYQVIRLQVFGYGESSIQKLIDKEFKNWSENIELGFRAAMPFLEVKLAIKSNSDEKMLTEYHNKIRSLLGEHVLANIKNEPQTLAEHVLTLLKKQSLKITTAESCTGGLIASLLTNIAGSSQVFEAGFVTYSNQMKTAMIDVSPSTLDHHGAVSEAVVIEMAQGALKKSNADVAIAVSGIAGPDGGSAEKPVGSVWIAWGENNEIKTQYFCIKGSRKYFQTMVANRALDLIRRVLIKSDECPNYIKSIH